MRVQRALTVLVAVCVLALTYALPSAAQPPSGRDVRDRARDGREFAIVQVQRGGGMSLQDAVQMATQRRPGRVVRAVTVESNGRRVHEIRILLEEGGRVVTVRIDAQTGESR